jgi:hypothetical protein
MSVFVVISTHTADQCPSANSKIRQMLTSDPSAMGKLMQKHGVKAIAGPYVSVDHRSFIVVDAPTVDALWTVAMESGLAQWNSVDFVPVKTLEEGLKEVSTLKPLY